MEDWIQQPVHFTVRLGEMKILSWRLPGYVLRTHFTQLPDHLETPLMLTKCFPHSIDVVVIRSHPLKEPLSKTSLLPEAIRYIPASYQRYWVALEGTFDTYLKKFSAKSRNTLMRKIKKFAEFCGGKIDWQEYQQPDEMLDFYQLALSVSKKTYQERLLDCGLPASEDFRNNMIALAKIGNARGYILFHQHTPIAYIFCPVYDSIALYEYVGHDPEYQRWSPGTLLQYFALQAMFSSENIKIFDFTEGEGAHKAFFATHSQYCADIYYFRRTASNALRIMLHASSDGLSRVIVESLDRLGVKAAVKKLIRSGT